MKKYSLPLILIGCLLLFPASGFAMPVSLNLLGGGLSILDSLFLIAVGLILIGILFLCIAFLKPEKEKPQEEESFFDRDASEPPDEEMKKETEEVGEASEEDDAINTSESGEEEADEMKDSANLGAEETSEHAEESLEDSAESEKEDEVPTDEMQAEQEEIATEPDEAELESIEENSGLDEKEEKEPEIQEEETVYPKLTLIGIRDNELKVLPLKQSVTIGRRRSCDLVLGDSTVSGIHCTIVSEDGKVFVHDEGSTNGTFVNAKKITEKTELHKGDVLSLGRQEFRVGF